MPIALLLKTKAILVCSTTDCLSSMNTAISSNSKQTQ